jgi:hypothetical protein
VEPPTPYPDSYTLRDSISRRILHTSRIRRVACKNRGTKKHPPSRLGRRGVGEGSHPLPSLLVPAAVILADHAALIAIRPLIEGIGAHRHASTIQPAEQLRAVAVVEAADRIQPLSQ